VTPKFISLSDPAAQWTDAHKGHAFFAYANNYLIDTDHGVIVDVEATRAIRQAEVRSARTMLERTETRFGIKLAFLTADSAYGFGGEPGLARQAEEDHSAHPGLRQVQPNRRYVLPRRLCLRRRTRPLHLSGGQKTGSVTTNLCGPQERRHSRGHKTLSRQQIGLRRLRTQGTLLPECSRPQAPSPPSPKHRELPHQSEYLTAFSTVSAHCEHASRTIEYRGSTSSGMGRAWRLSKKSVPVWPRSGRSSRAAFSLARRRQ
jgi:hypothetical protein